GDAVLLRTGWAKFMYTDPVQYLKEAPGLGVEGASWLRKKEVCAVACDNWGMEVDPHEDKDEYLPVHKELIRQGGIYILEQLDMEELARDMVYEFLFIVAPLGIQGGSGSPVNPLAIA
ncbi:MAG: cyclase family protein, partial [Chloroflexota bacterium]